MGVLLWPRGEVQSPKYMLLDHTAEDLQLEALANAMAFNNYYPKLLKIPASVKGIGKLYGTGSTNTDLRTHFEVSPEKVILQLLRGNAELCSLAVGRLFF